jgi:hypothetical protein
VVSSLPRRQRTAFQPVRSRSTHRVIGATEDAHAHAGYGRRWPAGRLAGCRKVLAPFSRPMRASVAMDSRHLHVPTASTCTDQRQVSLSMAYRICTLIDCAHLVQKGIQNRNFAAQPVNGLLVQHVKGTRTSGHDCQPSQTPIPTVSFTYMQTAARKPQEERTRASADSSLQAIACNRWVSKWSRRRINTSAFITQRTAAQHRHGNNSFHSSKLQGNGVEVLRMTRYRIESHLETRLHARQRTH